jgi:hypothetical protein
MLTIGEVGKMGGNIYDFSKFSDHFFCKLKAAENIYYKSILA